MDGAKEIKWTSFRALEPNPYPFTPMTQSIFEQGIEESSLIRILGDDPEYTTFHRGHLFFNFNQIHRFLSLFLTIPKSVLASYFRDEQNIPLDDISFRPSITGVAILLKMFFLSVRLAIRAVLTGYRIPKSPDIETLDDDELVEVVDQHLNYLNKSVDAHLLMSGLAEAYGVGIERFIPWSPTRSEVQYLLTRWTNSKTAEMARRASALENEQQLRKFLDEFGHRCAREMEIAVPRWADDPEPLRGFDNKPNRINIGGGASGTTNSFVWRILLIPGTLLERLRENPKNEWMKSYAYLRRLLLEIGRRAVESGHLEKPNDIFYLPIESARNLTLNPHSREYTLTTVSREKQRYEENNGFEPPHFMTQNFEPIYQIDTTTEDSTLDNFQGVGVSPGEITGTALLASTPEEVVLTDVGEPKILVTEFTDAGWTPLFFKIDGLIMERGSLLSHGSIVAREVGIPAVANVGKTANRINQGDRIRVNGMTGVIEKLN